jgi:hypothetical protein
MIISGLTHAALAPALLRFALCVATHAQGWLPAGWLAFTGRASNPLDRYERFPTNLVIPLSCPPDATTMNLAIEFVLAHFIRKSAIVSRITLLTTSSDAGTPGRIVLSHDPNEPHTKVGNSAERYCSRPWAMTQTWIKTW